MSFDTRVIVLGLTPYYPSSRKIYWVAVAQASERFLPPGEGGDVCYREALWSLLSDISGGFDNTPITDRRGCFYSDFRVAKETAERLVFEATEEGVLEYKDIQYSEIDEVGIAHRISPENGERSRD